MEFQPSQFFTQQLTAFELWLQHGSRDKRPPEQLPIVLQVRWHGAYARQGVCAGGQDCAGP